MLFLMTFFVSEVWIGNTPNSTSAKIKPQNKAHDVPTARPTKSVTCIMCFKLLGVIIES